MTRYSLLIFAVLAAILSRSQETTYGGKEEQLVKRANALGALVIIPFEDKMYLSDADAPIGRETGLFPGELQEKFSNSLLEALENELRKDWDLQVVDQSSSWEQKVDLAYIHASLQYRFELTPMEILMSDDSTMEKKDARREKRKKEPVQGIRIGQITVESDEREKFMNSTVRNDSLMPFLDKQLHSDYYLFINEFDIRYHVEDPDRVASGGLAYKLKVHYTCIDKQRNVLVSGANTAVVPASTENIYEIIKAAIPQVAFKLSKTVREFKIGR